MSAPEQKSPVATTTTTPVVLPQSKPAGAATGVAATAVEGDDLPEDLAEGDTRYAAYMSLVTQMGRTIGASPLTRYLAYTSDIGEGFRPVVKPWIVKMCYGISWMYVFCDTGVESYKRYQETHDGVETARLGTQRLTFNALASMAFPMFTIHTVVARSTKLLKPTHYNPYIKKWLPVAMGLSVVPALPFMFDHPVETGCELLWDFCWPSKYPHLNHSAHSTDAAHPQVANQQV